MIIDQLPTISPVLRTDEIPVERGTTTYKAPVSALPDQILSVGDTIPDGADLNDYTDAGVFICSTATTAGTLVNAPPYNAAFKLICGRVVSGTRLFQIAIMNGGALAIFKRYYSGTWTTWARQVDSSMLPLSLADGGTGVSAPDAITAINALGGRTFFYENIAASNTVTISASSLAGIALFFGGTAASRTGSYVVFIPNATTNAIVVPMANASGITITPSAGKITITFNGQTYMSVMCLYEATAGRLTITKT